MSLLARRVGCVLLAALSSLLGGGTVFAQRNLSNIPDPDAELERRSFQVADGFEVNLYAAEPMLTKPIQMNFDAAGRLWVACSEVYPQIMPGQTAHDRIVVLEDTNRDGRADKSTTFADGLLIPTGIEPGDGGAYVANSTELLHLKDSDGDGRADVRRVMLSGFGTEDTHHILHTFRWGDDGMLYFNQSIYIHSHVETPHGVRRLGGGGIWQFRPESLELDVFVRGFVNPWGHHFDHWGQSFVTDGAYGEGINYVFPGATFVTAPGAIRILKGLNPGSPKHCGLEVLSGRHLPESWRGNLITNDFRGNRVCRFQISDDGAGYASREQPELIQTAHVAFRPIDVKMGPDGAIYIADWYNPIIQHGEVDFRDPRRDHTHGRIWRVTAKGRPLVERPRLVDATIETLLDSLKAPEYWTRHFAKRLLKERAAESVRPALADWVARLDTADAESEHHRLEALWTYQSLDVVEPDLLVGLLRSRDPRVRAAATRVLRAWHKRLPDPHRLLAERVADEHPRVRLEAVRTLAAIPHAESAVLAMTALDRPVDRFLDHGLWLAARELQPHWLPAQQAGESPFRRPGHAVFALQAAGSPAVVKPLLALLRQGQVPADQDEAVLTLIGSLGGADELALVFDLAVAGDATPASRRSALLLALTKATRERRVRPAGDLTRLVILLTAPANDESLRALAARTAGLWKVESLRPDLLQLARSATASPGLRQAALDGVAQLGGPASREALTALAGAESALETRLMALAAMVSFDLAAAAGAAPAVLEACRNDTQAAEVFTRFLQQKSGPQAFATALKDRKLPADVAKVGVRLARGTGRDEGRLIAALTAAGGLTAATRQLTPAELAQMVKDVAERGDPARGELVFRHKELTCLKCHAISGAGGQVGPDLLSIGTTAQVDYLIDSLLDPNKAIKENYHSVVVATNDGKLLTGVKLRQTDRDLLIRDAEDRELAIPLATIEEQKPGGSLMPVGLVDSLTQAELIDLVRFLSELGKVGPYAAGQARLARRWQVLEATADAMQLIRHNGPASAAAGDSRLRWSPAYSMVSGLLPSNELPPFAIAYQGTRTGFARCQIEVSTAGKVRLLVGSADGIRAWLDGTALGVQPELPVDLSRGLHTLTLAIDLERRRDGVRLELGDAAGSAAQARFVSGN